MELVTASGRSLLCGAGSGRFTTEGFPGYCALWDSSQKCSMTVNTSPSYQETTKPQLKAEKAFCRALIIDAAGQQLTSGCWSRETCSLYSQEEKGSPQGEPTQGQAWGGWNRSLVLTCSGDQQVILGYY